MEDQIVGYLFNQRPIPGDVEDFRLQAGNFAGRRELPDRPEEPAIHVAEEMVPLHDRVGQVGAEPMRMG